MLKNIRQSLNSLSKNLFEPVTLIDADDLRNQKAEVDDKAFEETIKNINKTLKQVANYNTFCVLLEGFDYDSYFSDAIIEEFKDRGYVVKEKEGYDYSEHNYNKYIIVDWS